MIMRSGLVCGGQFMSGFAAEGGHSESDGGGGAGAAVDLGEVESWFSSIRLLSDAVVVEALGDLSNCPASDAEPACL